MMNALSMNNDRISRLLLVSAVVLVIGSGCIWDSEDKKKMDFGVAPTEAPLADSAAFRDTIGSFTYYEGLAPMQVSGYGLVVGLGKNGSADCPKRIYDQLVKSLYQQYHSSAVVGAPEIHPERMIADQDTAVVQVEGKIPPCASVGTRFGLTVRALLGTQTKSLRGGHLFGTELRIRRAVSPGASIVGQALARGSGPLFLNPFSAGDAATSSSPLEGAIVGGGVTTTDRRIRLVLSQPSYQRARQIQVRINAAFPGAKPVADAVSPSFVKLTVPKEFRDDTNHFLALVRALYLSRDPNFNASRARLLAEEIQRPGVPYPQIALALEGLGRDALPVLDGLYRNPNPSVSFYAAAAGLRLGDHIAGDAMILHAQSGEFRFRAIRALSRAKGMAAATMALRRLLDDGDPRVQIEAYEALFARSDSSIRSVSIGHGNFLLDHIDSQRPNFVYVKRSGARRIVLFGNEFTCKPPAFYRSPDGSVTINAAQGDDQLTLLRMVPSTGSTSPPIPVGFDLDELIRLMGSRAGVDASGEVVGLGLQYGAISRALYHLCKDGSINAKFTFEQPNAAELYGPTRRTGRPESEL